jgi:hypothetical protein
MSVVVRCGGVAPALVVRVNDSVAGHWQTRPGRPGRAVNLKGAVCRNVTAAGSSADSDSAWPAGRGRAGSNSLGSAVCIRSTRSGFEGNGPDAALVPNPEHDQSNSNVPCAHARLASERLVLHRRIVEGPNVSSMAQRSRCPLQGRAGEIRLEARGVPPAQVRRQSW